MNIVQAYAARSAPQSSLRTIRRAGIGFAIFLGSLAFAASRDQANAQYFEAESLTINASTTTVDTITGDSNYSNSEAQILRATQVGDSVTYLVPNIAAGTYEVSIGMKKNNTRGQFQLSASRADQNTYTNIGGVVDEYYNDTTSAQSDYMAVNVGQWSPGTTNNKLFKLTVTGKNSASSQFWLSIDYIVLTPNSIYSVASSSIPAPTGSGVMSFRVMNGTNGAYADNQIYWGILGQNPANGNAWSYLDINGNLQPISSALNNASGHLTKNGVNYANIYSTISQKQWISIPKINAARLYIGAGTPVYIQTFDTGFAGPNIDNPTDPNSNVYFDFTEFTIDSGGYHGNTTRVDQFGFPLQHRLINQSGSFDQTVGEYEWKTRSGLFSQFQGEVPSQFTSLATSQAPYRIVAPIHGSFAAGQPNGNYFSSYSSISTQDILLGTGGAADPNTCAALNRHVFTLPQADWSIPADYYLAAPANYYAWFWHRHCINELAYGFAYDDVNQQAAYLTVASPKGLIIRVGWQ
jgi:hypothetical protein